MSFTSKTTDPTQPGTYHSLTVLLPDTSGMNAGMQEIKFIGLSEEAYQVLKPYEKLETHLDQKSNGSIWSNRLIPPTNS